MSTLTVTNIQATGETASRAVSGVAAAWARYDGSSILADSFNVASTVDGGTTGETTVNFTNDMSDGNYAAQGTCNGTSGNRFATVSNQAASSFDTYTWSGTTRTDLPVGVAIHGDLA